MKTRWMVGVGLLLGASGGVALLGLASGATRSLADEYVVIAYNDLGMHCMNEDFSEMAILPPYNNLRAQVLKRGNGPDLVTEDVTVTYSIPSNTRSADKTNFWKYAQALLGVTLAPDVGLAGKGMRGTLDSLGEPEKYWEAIGIPITPINDAGRLDPYPLGEVVVYKEGVEVARTQTVIPVSQELNCTLCHSGPGISMETDILRDHDRLHGTQLEAQKPVLCASCHADPGLGAPGQPGVSFFSHAIHNAHADRLDDLTLANKCYACHPGVRTQCARGVHLERGLTCTDCHGGMSAVGDVNRQPWVDQPRCGSCHTRAGFEFEEPGKLFKDSRGHGGVLCITCHGSPHAILPAVTPADNAQVLRLQGQAGVLSECTVCHGSQPSESFFHTLDD